jgi:hypothetical protein
MALREILAHFGIEVEDGELDKADSKIGGFVEKLESAAGVVAGAFALHEVWEFAKSTTEAIDKVNDKATELGISAANVQLFGYAAKAAGQEADAFLGAMGRLQVSAANAGKEAGGATGQAFAKLGVKVKDANGQLKGADVLMLDVADKIAALKNPTERAAYATELFGRQGRALLPMLTKGRAGVDELRKKFDELGGGFDEDANKAAEGFMDALAGSEVAANGLRGELAKGILPPLTWIVNKAAMLVGWLVQISRETDIVRNGLIMIAAALTPMAIEMAISFAPLLLAAAAMALIVVAVDDLIGLFEGSDSLIGEWMDTVFGKGTSAQFVTDVKNVWLEIKKTFEEIIPVVKELWGDFKQMADWAGIISKVLTITPRAAGKLGDLVAQGVNAVKDVNYDPEETKSAARLHARRQAAGQGGTAPNPGQTWDQATAATDFVRARPGPDINQNNHVEINVNGAGDPAVVAQTVRKVIEDHHDEKNRDAHAALVQVAE